jgi:hypothetical protein
MKKMILSLACAATLIASTQVGAAVEVTAWVQNGFGSVSLQNLQNSHGGVNPKDVFTSICIQFWAPTSSGGVTNLASPSSLVTWAHSNNIKALLTVYNAAGGSWDWNLATSAFNNPDNFATNLVNAVTQNGMDGVDIDLEGNNLSDANDHRTQFSAFITSLSTKLKAQGKMLTVCSFDDAADPTGTNNVPNTSWWADWAGKADYIHTMLYAEGGELNDQGINGDDDQYFYSTQQQIGIDAGFPASAVSMGLPTFDAEEGGTWNAHVTAHLNECYAIKSSLCLWDLQLSDANWSSSSALWQKLAQFKSLASNFSLTINKTSGGTVTTNPAGSSFAPNTQVTLTAVPSS